MVKCLGAGGLVMKFPILAFIAATALSGAAFADTAPSAPARKVDPLYLPYETPGVFAKVPNGPTIHIKCMGSGSPTVILTAGMGGWAADWRTVQPQIAKTTRVCAWDRPGFGFSDGTTRPQTVADTTGELEAALKAAHIPGPYIAVGHSLGGYESLLFKDRNPRAVVGMVLVDPSVPDQFTRLHKAAPAFSDYLDHYNEGVGALYGRCLAGVKSGKLKVGAPDPDGCLAYPADYPAELEAALVKRDTAPLRFTAALSLQTNFRADADQVVNAARTYGDMPLIVLTAMKPQKLPGEMPQAAREQGPAEQAEWSRAHDAIAALSTRGVNRPIADATHYIQYDQPQAVIDAVNEVIAAARKDGAAKPAG